jgi:hypothetical protein
MRRVEVRLSRNTQWQKQNGWEVNEGDGVCPVYCGTTAKESALSYARQRAGYSPTEIQVLDAKWNLADIIPPEDKRALV